MDGPKLPDGTPLAPSALRRAALVPPGAGIADGMLAIMLSHIARLVEDEIPGLSVREADVRPSSSVD